MTYATLEYILGHVKQKMPIGIEKEIFLRLKKIRGGLSQKEFAKILGVNQATVCKYESGRLPDALTLEKIATFGRVTVEWLLHGEEKAGIPPELPGKDEALALESPARSSPLHEPFIFGGLDVSALTRIIEAVEDLLSTRKKPLKPGKKAFLISLLYDEFQKTGQPLNPATLQDFLKRVE